MPSGGEKAIRHLGKANTKNCTDEYDPDAEANKNERITDIYARYSSGELAQELTCEQIRLAKRAFVDTVAVAYGGGTTEVVRRLGSVLPSVEQHGSGTVLGRSMSAVDAALVNGTAAHELSLDDTSNMMKGHPSAVIIPAILATPDECGANGLHVLKSYSVGFQVAMSVAQGLGIDDHCRKGWHSTATVGTLGAVAAISYLKKQPKAVIRHALAIASSMAGGSAQNFGTMGKSLQVGLAAANAVRALHFAMAGITVNPDQLGGDQGFFSMHASNPRMEVAKRSLLGPSLLSREGVHVKQYPCCSNMHTAIDLSLSVSAEISPELIQHIGVCVQPGGLAILRRDRPRDSSQAKFSMAHAVASSIIDGHLNVHSYNKDQILRDQVQRLMDKVFSKESPIPPVGDHLWEASFTTIEIMTRDGRKMQLRQDVAKGHPKVPLSSAEFSHKIEYLVSLSREPNIVKQAIRTIDKMDKNQIIPRSIFAQSKLLDQKREFV